VKVIPDIPPEKQLCFVWERAPDNHDKAVIRTLLVYECGNHEYGWAVLECGVSRSLPEVERIILKDLSLWTPKAPTKGKFIGTVHSAYQYGDNIWRRIELPWEIKHD
jgi:hypothetical protein